MTVDEAAALFHPRACADSGIISNTPSAFSKAWGRRTDREDLTFSGRGEYGVHSELFTDGLFELTAARKVTNT